MPESGSRRPASSRSAMENVDKLQQEPMEGAGTDMYRATQKLRRELQEKGIKGFKRGGKVKKTGVYKLHKGEKVVTASTVRRSPVKKKAPPSRRR